MNATILVLRLDDVAVALVDDGIEFTAILTIDLINIDR